MSAPISSRNSNASETPLNGGPQQLSPIAAAAEVFARPAVASDSPSLVGRTTPPPAAAGSLPQPTLLNVSHFEPFEAFLATCTNCKDLTHAKLCPPLRLNFEALTLFLDACPHLQEIDLEGCEMTQLSYEDAINIIRKRITPSLRIINSPTFVAPRFLLSHSKQELAAEKAKEK